MPRLDRFPSAAGVAATQLQPLAVVCFDADRGVQAESVDVGAQRLTCCGSAPLSVSTFCPARGPKATRLVTAAALDRRVDALKRLPGIGPRSAQRIAFHLLRHDRDAAVALGEALLVAAREIRHCARCNTLTEEEICAACASPRRDAGLLCVVESAADQLTIE